MKNILNAALNELASLKIRDILIYETRGKSIFADYFVVATADSVMQLEGARGRLIEMMKKHKIYLKNPMEDWRNGWCLMDFGNLVIHVFTEESRKFYDLDTLFKSYQFDMETLEEIKPAQATAKKTRKTIKEKKTVKKAGPKKTVKKKTTGKKSPAKKAKPKAVKKTAVKKKKSVKTAGKTKKATGRK